MKNNNIFKSTFLKTKQKQRKENEEKKLFLNYRELWGQIYKKRLVIVICQECLIF